MKVPTQLPLDGEREIVELPTEGHAVSVETALNSRCTSDYDGNPEMFHWGVFDIKKRLSDAQIENIIDLAKIPRFTDRRVEIRYDRNILTFLIDKDASGYLRDWMNIESGMQQQAIGLVCAALGVGMLFKSLGADGTTISDQDHATIEVKLDPMEPTYDGSFWSSSSPADQKPWRRGSLLDPIRIGNKPLVSCLERLEIENKSGKQTADQAVSQLLWAARGRTPHLYKSRPWGMTIPTAGGRQNTSSVYFLSDYKLYRYVNWYSDRPTNSVEMLNEVDKAVYQELSEQFLSNNHFIVLAKNENFARALWEVGYQLLNLLLQAQALDLSYEAILLDENQQNIFRYIGIKDPIAALLLE